MPGITDAIEVPVDEEGRWSGTAGVFVEWRLNDLVAFQPEALYVAKGVTLANSAASYSLSFDARYLEMPMFVRFGPLEPARLLLGGTVLWLSAGCRGN
jgi:hypothetical protein